MSHHVLIADDSETLRTTVRHFLAPLRLAFSEACNGAEALVLVQKTKPDLVILDLAMPGLNGHEAAAALKHKFPGLPIILFTTHELDPSWKETLHVDAVVSKLSGYRQLVDCVRSLLNLPQPNPASPTAEEVWTRATLSKAFLRSIRSDPSSVKI